MTNARRIDLASEMRERAGVQPGQATAAAVGASAPDYKNIIAQERRRALDILEACRLIDRPDLAAGHVASGKPLGEVIAALERQQRRAQ